MFETVTIRNERAGIDDRWHKRVKERPLTAKPALSTHKKFMVPVFTADKSSVPGGRHQAVAVATNLTDALVPSCNDRQRRQRGSETRCVRQEMKHCDLRYATSTWAARGPLVSLVSVPVEN